MQLLTPNLKIFIFTFNYDAILDYTPYSRLYTNQQLPIETVQIPLFLDRSAPESRMKSGFNFFISDFLHGLNFLLPTRVYLVQENYKR